MEFWLPLVISVGALLISILSWHKNRAVYEIVIKDDRSGIGEINNLLISGEYTLLHVKQDGNNNLKTVYVLGRIKK